MKKNELREAVNILVKIVDEKISYKKSFNAKTTSLTKEICFGVCRNYFLLECIALNLVKKKPKDSNLWLTLLIGIYQIKFLSTPAYAAVKETVNLLNRPWEKNFINAILRNYLRNPTEIEQQISTHQSAKYNHPDWFIDKIKASWPDKWQSILAANNQHPPMSIRVNNSRITTEGYLELLQAKNIAAKKQVNLPAGIIINKPVKATELPGFNEGLVSVQDLAAQIAVQMLDLNSEDTVLDACAAPGGKTCHILETVNNLNKCLAIDIDEQRVTKIHDNLQRLKLHAKVIVADCLDTSSWWDGKPFTRILLDAPCSATGIIRRHPDIKLIRTSAEIMHIVQVQKKLLKKLWDVLAPGGKLVYATCSILPEENTIQIENFIKETPDCHLANSAMVNSSLSKPAAENKLRGDSERRTGVDTQVHEDSSTESTKQIASAAGFGMRSNSEYGLQILPGENNMDGFFYSVLIKDSLLG